MDEQPINLLLVEDDDDHADLFRRSLEAVDDLTFHITRVSEINRAHDALTTGAIDLIVLDYRLGLDNGLDFLRSLRASGERRPVIVLTGQGNEYVAVEMMRAGATDYLLKSDVNPRILGRTLQKALITGARDRQEREELAVIHERFSLLTPREREILELVVAGLTTPQISKKLHRSMNTVKIHRTNLMRKMQASTPADLARMVTMSGMALSAAGDD